jgi:pimeloyl-ACP methyl ester carboxylesterase
MAAPPLHERSLRLAGYKTRALELEGDGPLFLFLHGYSDSADTWRLTLRKLAEEGRRAVALDMPGFGRASPLSDGPVLPQLDLFATAAVEHFGADGGTIAVGNSLGGCTAMRIAAQEDLPLAGLVPVAPAGLDMARWIAVVRSDPVVSFLLGLPVPMPRPLLQAGVAQAYRRLVFRSPRAVAAEVVSTFAGHFDGRETLRRYLGIAGKLWFELQEPFELERISAPLMLVWGDSDLLVFSTGAEKVLETVRGSTLEVIPRCGHCPQLETPDRFTELLLDFAASAAPAASPPRG